MSVKAKKWILAKAYKGDANLDNFAIVEENIDKNIKDGELLVEAEYLTVDPYMRITPFLKTMMKDGDALPGKQVARVIASKSSLFPIGSYVIGSFGWRTHTVCSVSAVKTLPDVGPLSRSVALGALNTPGMTAYFGVLEILDPKPGQVVVVSTAAGAVGSIVVQICKLKGCKVIGSAGSDEKVQWLRTELLLDYAFNYKTTKLEDVLKTHAPDGVDCYFDNVGGEFASTMVPHMKPRGRIACCGSISTYKDDDNQPKGTCPWYYVVTRQLFIRGFLGWEFEERWPEAQKQILEWIVQGKVKNREELTEGFENMPQAFINLFSGKNFGKAIVRV